MEKCHPFIMRRKYQLPPGQAASHLIPPVYPAILAINVKIGAASRPPKAFPRDKRSQGLK